MSLYNLTPDLVSTSIILLHAIGEISMISSAFTFYFLLYKTANVNKDFARHLMHVQVGWYHTVLM